MKRLALAVSLLLTAAAPAQAETFPVVGARALAMGGTGVASATGPTASYWNPAQMALQPSAGSLQYGQGTSDPDGLAGRLDDLAATRANQSDIKDRPADA